MSFWDLFRRTPETGGQGGPRADVGGGTVVYSLDDPRVIELLRDGFLSAAGFTVNPETALRNPAFFRAVSLISNSIGMLPLNLIEKETKEKAVNHPLHRLLHRKPNDWQSAFDFRALMQLRALVHRNSYALIVRSRDVTTNREKVIRLVPLDPRRMEVWGIAYFARELKVDIKVPELITSAA